MTLLACRLTREHAYIATDTNQYFPAEGNRIEQCRKYEIFCDLKLVIFMRGSDVIGRWWFKDFRGMLMGKTLSGFLQEDSVEYLRSKIEERIKGYAAHERKTARQRAGVDLYHFFIDPAVGIKGVRLFGRPDKNCYGLDEIPIGGFGIPFPDARLGQLLWGNVYFDRCLIPAAEAIREQDANSCNPTFIGGELEVVEFRGTEIRELGSIYTFP